jgi:hypothetical protein
VTRVAEAPMSWKQGGCHCGAVRYEVLAPDAVEAVECNCSMCRKSGFLHLEVEQERFRLLQGADKLTTYSFNTGTAKHHFCSICGVKSFYVPRSKRSKKGGCARTSTIAWPLSPSSCHRCAIAVRTSWCSPISSSVN